MSETVRQFPIPAAKYLPHREAMCCIDEILDCRGAAIKAGVTLHSDHVLLTAQGILERSGFIELAAQAGCALMGLSVPEGEMPASAWLAGVQDFEVVQDAKTNDTLIIDAAITRELAEIRVLDFKITTQNQLLATGSLKVFYQG
ncbi:hypothetical protein TUM12370_07320 [Salmonella enterica subsp. enterica serovar Choleraesuis]|nr:hypothetical protein TUM12370_07320 [Salmonella enterica subsp. enterica serovar Choleraesuis]